MGLSVSLRASLSQSIVFDSNKNSNQSSPNRTRTRKKEADVGLARKLASLLASADRLVSQLLHYLGGWIEGVQGSRLSHVW